MLYLIVILILIIFSAIIDQFDIEEFVIAIIVGLICSFLIYFLIGGMIGIFIKKETYVAEEKPIYALNDSTGNYLLCGNKNDVLTYHYLVDTEHGKHIESVKSNLVYLQEGDYEPMIKIYKQRFTEQKYEWIAWYTTEPVRVEFYIPEDTIEYEYHINLQ